MSKKKKIDLSKKWIVAFDTICTGWDTGKDENDQPYFYDSELEAYKEILDDIDSKSYALEMETNLGEDDEQPLTKKQKKKVKELMENGTVNEINEFLSNNDVNYYDEFVVRADEYIQGRKAIFTGQNGDGKGGYITGKKLEA